MAERLIKIEVEINTTGFNVLVTKHEVIEKSYTGFLVQAEEYGFVHSISSTDLARVLNYSSGNFLKARIWIADQFEHKVGEYKEKAFEALSKLIAEKEIDIFRLRDNFRYAVARDEDGTDS